MEFGVDDRTRRDFLPVVILRFHPENGNGRDAMFLLNSLRQLHRSECFVQAKCRASEQTRLLSGDDGDGLRLGEQRGGRAGSRRRIAMRLLRLKNSGNDIALARMALRA